VESTRADLHDSGFPAFRDLKLTLSNGRPIPNLQQIARLQHGCKPLLLQTSTSRVLGMWPSKHLSGGWESAQRARHPIRSNPPTIVVLCYDYSFQTRLRRAWASNIFRAKEPAQAQDQGNNIEARGGSSYLSRAVHAYRSTLLFWRRRLVMAAGVLYRFAEGEHLCGFRFAGMKAYQADAGFRPR